jgi:4-amino-4-deoxychorismate lyase
VRFRYVIGPDGSVDPRDRGLAYGDGLFETMALRGGELQRLGFHFDRLELGCARLALPRPARRELKQRIESVASGISRGYVKLILTRGVGRRGYAPPQRSEPTIVLLAEASMAVPAAEISVATLSQRLGENEKLAEIKHLCRLEQVLGRLELSGLDADEGLMLSTSGAVIGGTSRNLFAVFGRRLVTPDLSRAGIGGVMRRSVLEEGERLGLDVTTADLRLADLEAADELFMTNALVGIQSVSRLDDRPFTANALAAHLRDALRLNDDV